MWSQQPVAPTLDVGLETVGVAAKTPMSPPTVTPPNTEAPENTVSTQAATALAGAAVAAAPTREATPTPTPTETPIPKPTATSTSEPTATDTPLPRPTVTPTEVPAPAAGATRTNPQDEAVYVYVPAGPFIMGSTEEQITDAFESCQQAYNNKCELFSFEAEAPQSTINVDEFWIMRTEVTNAEYKLCRNAKACTEDPKNSRWNDPQFGDHPVTDVTWYQANEYAKWVGGRLPTEAEWEKACRGTDGQIYPWGDSDPTADLANFSNNVGDTTPVGKYSPRGDSPYHIVDMSGNLLEWTSNQYANYPYDPNDGREDPEGDAERTVRGGAWSINDVYVRCAFRYHFSPVYWSSSVGFRVVSSGF